MNFFFMCQDNQSQRLQKKMPEDFSIALQYTDGRASNSHKYFLSSEQSYFEERNNSATRKVFFEIAEGDLRSIYQKLINNNFLDFESDFEKVDDGMSVSILVQYGKNKIRKLNGDANPVKKKWRKAYSNIQQAIVDLSEDKLKPLKREVSIKLDESVFLEHCYTYFEFEKGNIQLNTQFNAIRNDFACSIHNGDHYFSVFIRDKKNGIPRDRMIDAKNFVIPIDQNVDEIVFYFENNELKYELKQK